MHPVPPIYVYQAYPKVLYHIDGSSTRVVNDAGEHGAAGPEWFETPTEAAAGVPAASAEPAPEPEPEPEPEPPAADPAPAVDTDQAEAASVHAATVAVLLEKLKGAPLSTLLKVKGYEEQNPKPRKGLLQALDEAILDAANVVE